MKRWLLIPIDILAPGNQITSLWINGTDSHILDGTSMATPHVAGLGAYLLGLGVQATDICEYIKLTSTENVVSEVPSDTLNLLVYNGAGE
jgi:cerevisin